ncbi:NAD(P)H-dependent oxidoreductase [Nocardiopsis sp. RSe5-2]|uniref:NAD(P)H-dependent oxidoreductase n=1 Tax=Nocardiopsis endophytica TaxID=3018445 RepID=A0ABT4U321_9ACTN|nr:NAD(P)H-dependent oxidoreductase [Nocardiopsis endophytica]MDA2811359.1 NAD(P)H-dependent oxidoreductase [Nocardiopsis endophytica]
MDTFNETPLRIAVVIGSTRPDRRGDFVGIDRKGAVVGRWVQEKAQARGDAEYTLVDLAEVGLPMFDEPLPPAAGQYTGDHTRSWSRTVDGFDAFVFVTPEYNRSVPAALKNAVDYLYTEWHDKAAAFVGYGAVGGTHAVDHLRGILSEVRVAHVQAQVMLNLYTDFEDLQHFAPADHQEEALGSMIDQLLPWARAMRSVREKDAVHAPAGA